MSESSENISKTEDGEKKPVLRISVRSLVEFILREGDIDRRRGGKKDQEAMLLGGRIHRKIQGQKDGSYQAEVSLRRVYDCGDYDISVEGRADGVFSEGEEAWIDEIKGIFLPLNKLMEPVGVHLAQAKCYACFAAEQRGIKTIGVQMTYCNMDTEEIKYFRQSYDTRELEDWFLNLMEEYRKWTDFQQEWKRYRNQSIKGIEFPFSYRDGQRELVQSVYRTMLRKKRLFIQAPTGVGKTIATVFPAAKAVGEGLGEKIFYLTAKTITRTAAAGAFAQLKEQGLSMKVITITAKEKLCACEEMDCRPESCPFAKGHFDRVNDAVYDLITTEEQIDRDILLEYAKKHNVCPFEMCLDASEWADAVICDYNYVFDPTVHLKRFFGEGMKGDYLFLIDEAHNLVERGREMFSAVLYKEDFLEVKRNFQDYIPAKKLVRELERCNKTLLELKRECDQYEILETTGNLSLHLLRLMGEMEKFLEEPENQSVPDDTMDVFMDLYFGVRSFLNIFDRMDENYVIYTEHEGGRFRIKLFCINPSVCLREALDKGNSTVFFSATFLPIHYYKELLSGEPDDYAVYAQSPFDPDHRLLLIGRDVSSKYTRRNSQEFERIAEYIIKLAAAKAGNYLVFFPSYQMLMPVYECFLAARDQSMECIVQEQGMREKKREEFLQAFEEEREGSLIGFCVMGGIFSEGIDLQREALIGAVIVGTGLPQICNEREILRQYYEDRQMDGFDYAYRFSGMNKVLQAAGRVIRTDDDKGVILLLDDRFCQYRYRQLFPREWERVKSLSLNQAGRELAEFWDGKLQNME